MSRSGTPNRLNYLSVPREVFFEGFFETFENTSHFLFAGRCTFSRVRVRENCGRIGFLYIDFQISFVFYTKLSRLCWHFEVQSISELLWGRSSHIFAVFLIMRTQSVNFSSVYIASLSVFCLLEVLLLFVCLFYIFFQLMSFILCYVYVCISFSIIY